MIHPLCEQLRQARLGTVDAKTALKQLEFLGREVGRVEPGLLLSQQVQAGRTLIVSFWRQSRAWTHRRRRGWQQQSHCRHNGEDNGFVQEFTHGAQMGHRLHRH